MQLSTSYGIRAGYEGSSLLFFDIDKNFQIISKNLTKIVCN
jgi:hypothetical protein